MVRIKLFTFEEWLRAMDVPKETWKENPLPVESFESLLRCYLEEETETPPFRDEESLGLLKGGGLTFVSDDDWYSVYGEGWGGKGILLPIYEDG